MIWLIRKTSDYPEDSWLLGEFRIIRKAYSWLLRSVRIWWAMIQTLTTATDPNIRGSWKFHEFLPTDLDSSILSSSCCVILGQPRSKYAIGNTYQEALSPILDYESWFRYLNRSRSQTFEGISRQEWSYSAELFSPGYIIMVVSTTRFMVLAGTLLRSEEPGWNIGRALFDLPSP